MKKWIVSLVLLVISVGSFANEQDSITKLVREDRLSLGLGVGLNYGMLGANFLAYPQKNIGLFAGVGFLFGEYGYCGGAKIRYISKSNYAIANPFLIGMYGVNAFVIMKNELKYETLYMNTVFNGFTFGAGLDFYSKPKRKGYFSLAVLFPQRTSEFHNHIETLKADPRVTLENNVWPFTLSLGYRLRVQ